MEKRRFKLKLDFRSLLLLTGSTGFFAGVVSIPLFLLLEILRGNSELGQALIQLIFMPFIAGFNGLLFGLVGYPLYAWYTTRKGPVYSGVCYIIPRLDNRDDPADGSQDDTAPE